ncbi:hypothetical protein RSSM_02511 [Rhodopirellula sallentina SM41]|uniref:Uncharacterized protein n=1 Tax=Rhodopirellula sallentina SM41 TaxID=1263870 RepID=M5U441_9BACT|nr:hypothetical protein RSSM_02511 [Rhodopirellula sallentina SM41]
MTPRHSIDRHVRALRFRAETRFGLLIDYRYESVLKIQTSLIDNRNKNSASELRRHVPSISG